MKSGTIQKGLIGSIAIFALAMVMFFAVMPISQADLPPRPTPTAVPMPSSTPQGARIVLQTLQTQAEMWTVVQWQDINGDWHNVDGWRGSSVDGSVQWWVAQKDFGTGPFRWAVYSSEEGELSAASETFHMPTDANQTLVITVP